MASEEQKMCTQFYADSFCKDMISFGKWVNQLAYFEKSYAYFTHSVENKKGHMLILYILPTDKLDMEGVKYRIKFLDPRASGFRILTDTLGIKSTSKSAKDIDTFMDTLLLMRDYTHLNRYATERYIEYWDTGYHTHKHYKDNNDAAINFIEEKLGYNDEKKLKSFEEFKKLFSLSCLYVEHKTCESLKQQRKHCSVRCMLCKRIEQNNTSREPKLAWDEDLDDTNISDEVTLKTELLFDLKAIGYNIYGSHLVVNGQLYAKPYEIQSTDKDRSNHFAKTDYETYKVPLDHVPSYRAIACGQNSWIQAFIAVGIQPGKDFTDGELVKYTLHHAPSSRKIGILKILLANGVVLEKCSYQIEKPYNYSWLNGRATSLVQENNHQSLKQLTELPKIQEKELIPIINEAAGQLKTKCLEALLHAAHKWNPKSLTQPLELCAEGPFNAINQMLYSTNEPVPVQDRVACMKLLLSAGTSIKDFKMRVRMWPILKEEETVLLLYAAGFKNLENQPVNLRNYTDHDLEVPEIFLHLDKKYRAKRKNSQDSGDIPVPTLLETCREVVRDELTKYNIKNLFHVVPLLPLPQKVKGYLLHGATLQTQD